MMIQQITRQKIKIKEFFILVMWEQYFQEVYKYFFLSPNDLFYNILKEARVTAVKEESDIAEFLYCI